jgi:hypothetical protein
VASLEDLRMSLLPAARVVPTAGDPAAARIGWVRLMKPRVPAFDALDRGDLAIVPASALAVVAPGDRELETLVDACLRAGVSGLVLLEGDEPLAGEAPGAARLDALAGVLRPTEIPAIRSDRADPAALERSVIGFLVNRRAELDRQAAILEARLEGLALAETPLDDLVGAIATFLGRPVALESRRGDPLVVHAPPGDGTGGAAVAAYHARPRSVALRIQLPATTGAAGSVALLGERPVTELDRVVTGRIAGLLALALARDVAVQRARDAARRGEAMPSAGPPWIVLVARQRRTDGPATEDREAVRRELRQLAPLSRLVLRGDADSLELRAVIAAGKDDPEGTSLASRVAGLLGRSVALSRPFGTAGERPAAEAEARETLEAVERLPEAPTVARADRLPAYRLLGSLATLPDGARQARALLEPVLAGRPDVRREHLATLRAILDHAGPAEAAAALGVHRNTVAYRVRRIEALTGWRLTDPELRLPLALALRLVQEAQD